MPFAANGQTLMCVTVPQYFDLLDALARQVEWAKMARNQLDHYRGCQK